MVRDLKIDWLTLLLYVLFVMMGWFNLYSTSSAEYPGFFNMNSFHGKEALFILASFVLGIFIIFLDTKFLEFLSYILYGGSILALVGLFVMSKATGGATSWYQIGAFKLQPTEFAKVATLLALAKHMSRFNFSMKNRSDMMTAILIVLLPAVLVLLQNDAGSALVFFGMIIIFYREGLHPLVIIGAIIVMIVGVLTVLFSNRPGFEIYIFIGLILLTSISFFFIFRKRFLAIHIAGLLFLSAIPFTAGLVLKPYQTARFRVLVESAEKVTEDMTEEQKKDNKALQGASYNLLHSLLAIGSGGLSGKGFGNATHTRGNFVPEEHTDYIFCVVGEEHGFIGSAVLLILFFLLLWRIIYIAENAKSVYARILGYGIVSVFGLHTIINIGMTIGLVPTIGIPLPFFSYGGSSIVAFSFMMFILINHYSYRTNIMT